MRQVAHVLLTRPPLNPFPKELHSLDLHVLGTPPAFVLSQDQTLNKKFNLLLKLLWVFIRLKRIAGFILTIFCSIFKDHFISSPSSDFIILTPYHFYVNNFLKILKTYFWYCIIASGCPFLKDKTYNIILLYIYLWSIFSFFTNYSYFTLIFYIIHHVYIIDTHGYVLLDILIFM